MQKKVRRRKAAFTADSLSLLHQGFQFLRVKIFLQLSHIDKTETPVKGPTSP